MQKSLLKFLLAVVALTLSAAVHALGMGGINVASALGQQLQADIELVAVGKAERGNVTARLATVDAYKSAGLEYPYSNKFKFQIEARANGEPYLKVSSEQPINDPFVSLLIELNWPSGRLLREYTFLLDPPGYAPEQPVQAEVNIVAPVAQIEPVAVVEPVAESVPVEPALSVEVTVPEPAVQGVGQSIEPEQATQSMQEQSVPVEVAVEHEVQIAPSEEAHIPVKTAPPTMEQAIPEAVPVATVKHAPERLTVPRGGSLYGLAEQNKPADTSVERMLVALYRTNVEEFEGKNMNRIRAGKILRMPDNEELQSVTQSEAENEIRIQSEDWNAYRQKLAVAATVSSQPQASQQVAIGKITGSVVDKTPVAKDTAKEVLKLSKGEAPGDHSTAVGGKGLSLQSKKDAARENAIANAKAREAEQARAALLEKNLKDMQRLAQLKSEAAALAAKSADSKAKPDAAPNKAEATTKADATPTGGAKVESAVKPKPKAQPKAVEPEPSMADQLLAEPLYMAGAAAILLGLGGLGFVMIRRKKDTRYGKKAKSSEDATVTSHIATPVAPSPETGDFTQTAGMAAAVAQVESIQQPDSVDPISEADLFLSFGRDGQAEEILREALRENPGNHQIHLKLLGIYANRQDTNSFGEIAGHLKDSGDEYAWQQAAEMGRKLDPENPMYGGFRSMEDTGSATVQMAAFNASQPPVSASAPTTPSVLDFDFNLDMPQESPASPPEQELLGDMEKTTVLSAPEVAIGQMAAMDFDITSTQPMSGQAEAALPASEKMDFDVTGSQEMSPLQSEADKTGESGEGVMEFTLDFPIDKPAEKPAPEPATAAFAGINLNFDEAMPASETQSGEKGENWQEVATKLDLAKAYQEMGDASGAREILDEVMREGDAEQRQAAQALLEQLA